MDISILVLLWSSATTLSVTFVINHWYICIYTQPQQNQNSREQMVEKALADIPKFDRKRAEMEVDKYLKDPEILNYHIEFKKRLAENPSMLDPPPEEGFFSFRTLLVSYIAYVFGEIAYQNFFRQYVDLDFIPGWAPRVLTEEGAAAADAAASVSVGAIQNTVDAAANVVDAVSNSM